MNDGSLQSTDQLIGRLGAQLQPVRPLRPPVIRALLWLLGIAALLTPLVLRRADLSLFAARNNDMRFALELAATLATGIVAVVAAFVLQFFHPFDVTVLDLGIHAATVGLIMGAAATLGRRALNPQTAL